MTRKLPMLEAGDAGRRDDCRNLSGCLARWINFRSFYPKGKRGKRAAEQQAQCPPECASFERIPRAAEIAMAMKQRTNWREGE